MNATGSVILLSSVALLVIVGAVALNDLHTQVTSNDTNIQQQASVSVAIEKPLLMLFSYGAIILGAFCAINAYAKM
jgi:hypothetical protein